MPIPGLFLLAARLLLLLAPFLSSVRSLPSLCQSVSLALSTDATPVLVGVKLVPPVWPEFLFGSTVLPGQGWDSNSRRQGNWPKTLDGRIENIQGFVLVFSFAVERRQCAFSVMKLIKFTSVGRLRVSKLEWLDRLPK